MKEIKVHCRNFVEFMIEYPREKIRKKAPWALISIYSTKNDKLIHESEKEALSYWGCVDFLSLCFKDYVFSDSLKIGKREGLFDEADAYKIKNFVDSLKARNIQNLMVHCDAGVSRSGAVGLWACRYLGYDEAQFRKANPMISPNSHIYDILYVISGMKASYEEFWNKEVPPEDRLIP